MELLSILRRRGVELWGEGDRLRYSAPEGTLTPELKAELTVAKAQILALLEKAAVPAARPPLVPTPRGAEPPASLAQERLWFLDQLAPGAPLYNLPAAVMLEGELQPAVLARALAAVARRHEALRTTFAAVGGRPVQVIHPRLPVGLPVVDLSALAPDEGRRRAEAILGREARRPFDLAAGPLLRAVLLRLDRRCHAAQLTMHHIVSDGWSMRVLVAEVTALYRAFAAGEPSPLPPLPVQYADYAAWQRGWLKGEVVESQLAFHRRQLEGLPQQLDLPTDRPRPPRMRFAGARRLFSLPPAASAELEAQSRGLDATLFMTLLAAFSTLLGRWSGREAFLVGTPIANRTAAEVEALVGFFVNTLVLPARLAGDPPWAELVGRVRQAALGAYAHQDLPFALLVEALRPERDLSRTPLFQVMFVLQNLPPAGVRAGGLEVRPLAVHGGVARFDWTLNVWRDGERLVGELEYATDLFDATTIQRATDQLTTLLAGAAAHPERRLSRLPLLPAAQRQQVLVEVNGAALCRGGDPLAHRAGLAWGQSTPDAVAMVFCDEHLTYGELVRRSRRIAVGLRRLGVGPEALVGLCLPRGPSLLPAVLGTLAAGGAFLPLDPTYPTERLVTMLEDSRAPVLLTEAARAGELPAGRARAVAVDALLAGGEGEGEGGGGEHGPSTLGELDAGLDAANLAYVIYTSGSTGRPKGVALSHRGLANLAQAQVRIFALTPEARVLQFAALSFDAAVWELLVTLTAGARLVLARTETLLPGGGLEELLAAEAVTVVTLPPSALAVLEPVPLPALATLVVAGEACRGDLVERWAPGRRFFNAYGPTETTVCATAARLGGARGRPTTIGLPIRGHAAFVLDGRLTPLPLGVPGQLYLGGEGLARGYLGRPALTAARFIPHPFPRRPGQRLYASGDRVRRLPAGELDFLGRLDLQVKVRGFRIELGEVEAALARQPGVKEVAVVAQEAGGGLRLAAFIVPAGGGLPPADALRTELGHRLPEYMLPAAFVEVDALPLTPAGKVDRRALAAATAAGDRPRLGTEFVPARTSTEKILAGVWGELLGLDRVGVEDSFFDLGGHSLLATRVCSRVKEELGLDIPVDRFFETPTIAGLARYLETLCWAAAAATADSVDEDVEEGLL